MEYSYTTLLWEDNFTKVTIRLTKIGRENMITTNIIIAVGVGMVVEHFLGLFGKVFGFVSGLFSK